MAGAEKQKIRMVDFAGPQVYAEFQRSVLEALIAWFDKKRAHTLDSLNAQEVHSETTTEEPMAASTLHESKSKAATSLNEPRNPPDGTEIGTLP
jgi:hypothetical protein